MYGYSMLKFFKHLIVSFGTLILTQIPGSRAKQRDFLCMISRGTGFDQMLVESLINSYEVSTMICLGKINACQNMLLGLINYFSRLKATIISLSNVVHYLNPSATSENI